ncbi:MAG: hypothetical protein R3293_27195 [Candidatus Promineifilaceae bacterium]|nr:hypothetical protein [Candidatus Promineifilaceae bacterium]
MTDEQIIAVAGERPPLNGTIYLTRYEPQWPLLSAQLKKPRP